MVYMYGPVVSSYHYKQRSGVNWSQNRDNGIPISKQELVSTVSLDKT